jgi:D-alanine-D-alanine ligase
VRIDFMVSGDNLTLTEINPIPGSMAFYLWEAKGIPFQQQITDMLKQAIRDQETRTSLRLDYTSDIVEKFITQ